MTTEKWHEIGVKRHGAAWSKANQRAVDALTGSQLKPWDRHVKDALPQVILRILDGVRLDAGEQWLAGASEWTPAIDCARAGKEQG